MWATKGIEHKQKIHDPQTLGSQVSHKSWVKNRFLLFYTRRSPLKMALSGTAGANAFSTAGCSKNLGSWISTLQGFSCSQGRGVSSESLQKALFARFSRSPRPFCTCVHNTARQPVQISSNLPRSIPDGCSASLDMRARVLEKEVSLEDHMT